MFAHALTRFTVLFSDAETLFSVEAGLQEFPRHANR
jgi:hypothetical protein